MFMWRRVCVRTTASVSARDSIVKELDDGALPHARRSRIRDE